MPRIICTEDMPCGREAFETLGEVQVLPERTLRPEQVRDADILAVRSTTKVGPALLEGSRVGFVGTATIGMDHLDTAYFDRAGIKWCSAAGCNANSVSEYLVAGLLALGRRHGFDLAGKTIGIVGVGNVGTRVAEKANALGLRVLLNDPPKQRMAGGGQYLPLDQVLAGAGIVTMHVPLEKGGDDPTWHLADRCFFEKMKPGCLFVNAARGAVVDSDALLRAMDQGRVAHCILDTWEGEPVYRPDVLRRVDLGTPHIAGHSYEGKVVGTWMVYQAACRFLGRAPAWTPQTHLASALPGNPPPAIEPDGTKGDREAAVAAVVRQAYDIEKDDGLLRRTLDLPEDARIKEFNRQRKQYAVRREFPYFTVRTSGELGRRLECLGFQVNAF
ncbi:MAG: 4-phosphoerythronate dehydrogenase [Verrucomicrobiae bacterium]|nr:4-phosphoerythronate dehydrogenase [Verrucomicrobiae bacterium]